MPVDFGKVSRDALGGIAAVLSRYAPGGVREGNEYVALNPTRTDARLGSFKVNLQTGAWGDFACSGVGGGDLISLVAYVRGLSQYDAAIELQAYVNGGLPAASIPVGRSSSKRKSRLSPEEAGWTFCREWPSPAPTVPWRSSSPSWLYRGIDGRPIMYTVRFAEPGGGKRFAPCTLWERTTGVRTDLRWWWAWPAKPFPLYGLERLAGRPRAAVVICEGEKAADAAQILLEADGVICLSSCGPPRSAQFCDWSPLQGRAVFAWPDADPPGYEYVAWLGETIGAVQLDLTALGPLPKGWDAGDALEEGRLVRLQADAIVER